MKLVCFLLVFFSQVVSADSKIPGQLSFALGSISANYTENPDQLKASDGTTAAATTPYAGTASAMPVAITYEYFPNLKRAYFVKVVGPLMASTPDRYYSATLGVNYYFGKVATMAVVSDTNFEMKLIPKLRYFAGPAIGMGYIVYNTKSAIKNDIMFEIGGQGGVIYALGPQWALRAELGAARGIGALVSSTIIKILIGATYNLGI
jgi:hypothetical protein